MDTGVDRTNARGSAAVPRRRRLGLGLGLLLVAAAVAAVLLGSRSSPPRAGGETGHVVGVAIVQRRDLVQTDTESGTLGYADPQTVYDRLSGTITWLPAVGQVIDLGHALYSVDGRPVALLDGALSAYRALTDKDSPGQDILQLNRDLVEMGFADGEITIDRSWQAGTTDAVKRWQGSLGQTQTGLIALGRVVFLPGPQRVTQLATTCGSTGSGATSSGSGSAPTNGCGVTETSARASAPHLELIDFTTSSTTTPATTPPTATNLPPITTAPTTTAATTTPTTSTTPTTTPTTTSPSTPAPATTQPPSSRSAGAGAGKGTGTGSGTASGSGERKGGAGGSGSSGGSAVRGSGASGSGASGQAPQSASVILQTTSTKLVVTVDLAANSQSEAAVGSHVTVEMPTGSRVAGTVTALSGVAQNLSNNNTGNNNGNSGNSGGGSGSSATVPVTIALDQRVSGAGLDQAAVSVDFAQAKASNVLSVPVTALIATSGQTYAVQQAGSPYKLIPVTPGLFAGGYVEISGAGVSTGLHITDSQG